MSDRRVWLTSNEDNDRLVSITREHIRLVKQALDKDTTLDQQNAITVTIDALRCEREAILAKYN